MIDLHIHSIFSDGELVPSEVAARARSKGYRALALTDHVDTSNISFVIENISRVAADLTRMGEIVVLPGVEITHVPPPMIGGLIKSSREMGAAVVIVHGETIVEPVSMGTNLAAIKGGADILAHPGLISIEDASLAMKKGVLLEITSRRGHSYTNGHVVMAARETGAKMVFNTDSHSPQDFLDRDSACRVLQGAGIGADEISAIFRNSEAFVDERR